MTHRWRMIRLIALLSIVALLIAACGQQGNQSGGQQGAQTAAPAAQATQAPAAEATQAPAAEATQAPAAEATTAAPGGAATMAAETATADGEMAETATAGVGAMTETVTAGAAMAETATAGGVSAGTTATAGAGGTTGTAAGGGAAPTLPADCSNVELQYWNPFTGPDGPFMGQMTDAFNAAQGGKINVTMTSQSEYYTQIETAAAAQQLPDIAIIHADQVPKWAFRNVLRPIDEIAQQVGVAEGDFPEAVWSAGEVAGKRYSIPLDIHPMTMFYNNDLLTAAGLNAPPKNRQEFEAAAQAMTKDGNNGFLLTTGFPIQQIFSMLLHQNGGSWFNEDGTKATWNSDAGVQALTWLKEAQTKYGQENLEVDAELNAFKGGTVGMIWNGIWQTTNVTGSGVEFAGMATAVPQIGSQPAVWGGSHQFTLPTRAGEADQCKDAAAAVFIRYMLDNSTTWARAGQIPANNRVRESLTGGGGAAGGGASATATAGAGGGGDASQGADLSMIAQIAPSAENLFLPPAVPGITDAFPPLDEAVAAVMAGQATDVKAALDDAAARADQILQQNKEQYGEAPQAQ